MVADRDSLLSSDRRDGNSSKRQRCLGEVYVSQVYGDMSCVSRLRAVCSSILCIVRSGIVHSLLPNHKPPKQQKSTKTKAKPKKKQERFKPAATSDSASPPQVQKIAGFPRRDLLVIGAPHLLACTKQMLADFRKRPITREHRRFMKRFVQTVYDETPAGLVRKTSS